MAFFLLTRMRFEIGSTEARQTDRTFGRCSWGLLCGGFAVRAWGLTIYLRAKP